MYSVYKSFFSHFNNIIPMLGIRSLALLFFTLLLPLHFKQEPQEQFAPIALYKKSDMRECCLQEKSDRNNSLFLRVIHFKLVFFTMLFPLVCSKQKSESLKKKRFASVKATRAIHTLKIANSTFPLSFSNNKWFAWKTKERIPNPA